ncbi:MAG: aminoglycoside 6-N-acetyltransferase [Candidatus Eremiobacteraeota bacterium]|jgi:aminoglycoside 6'-N-acetyltransferase|nr:aminoglycoside 6-N-acetyltransferase [Candidatus Eremiobacteraeota bacterium]
MIRGDRTSLRRVTRDDLPLLAGWFGDPAFVQWWGGVPKSEDEVARTYLGRHEGDEIVHSFIVLRDDVPIGYVQAWSDEPLIGGIDIVLVPSEHGRRYGSDAVAALAHHVRDELGWKRITIDPSVRNQRAIRAFEKAGFVPEAAVLDPRHGPLLVMIYAPEELD